MWSAVRWQTYNLMCCSMADLKKVGIYRPSDLIKFEWDCDDNDDDSPSDMPTAEDIERMRQMMREYNEGK